MDEAQNAMEPGTFDLDEFVQGRGFPRDTVTVFTNADAAYERALLEKRLKDIAQDRDSLTKNSAKYKEAQAQYKELEARSIELMEAIKASALTFHLRGISPGHIKKINKDVLVQAEKEEWDQQATSATASYRIIAPHIIKVERADGRINSGPFTEDTVENLDMVLPESEWRKLDEKVAELSFKSAYFDAAVDAGFLQKS